MEQGCSASLEEAVSRYEALGPQCNALQAVAWRLLDATLCWFNRQRG